MYNQFTEQELSFILELIKESDIKERHLDIECKIINKITEELYTNSIFIEYFTKHDTDILYIYKYKSEAKYKIIVNNTSTRHVKQIYDLNERFIEYCPSSCLEFLICSYNECNKSDDNMYLVYERSNDSAKKEKQI